MIAPRPPAPTPAISRWRTPPAGGFPTKRLADALAGSCVLLIHDTYTATDRDLSAHSISPVNLPGASYSYDGTWAVRSFQAARWGASAASLCALNLGPGILNARLQATLTPNSTTGATGSWGFHVKPWSSDGNSGHWRLFLSLSGGARIVERINSTSTTRASSATPAFAAGVPFSLEATIIGNTLTFSINGVSISYTSSDPRWLSSTTYGFYYQLATTASGNAYWDDLQIWKI